jgi:hypothetical protein
MATRHGWDGAGVQASVSPSVGTSIGVLIEVNTSMRRAGIRAVEVAALNASAREFYKRFGFRASPVDDDLLFIGLDEAKHSLAAVTGHRVSR